MAEDGQTRIAPNQPVTPGTRLNGIFEIESKIAVGGMGEVYRGRNITTSEPVAIKIVLPEFSRDEMIRELFFKEARVLGSLNHPVIVRYQMFTIEPVLGRPYLVMEYIDGCSLDEMIQSSKIAVPDVKVLVAKVADALEAAHQAGVVHRDLSPDNILLVNRNLALPRIIDFGIARTLQAGASTILGNKFAGRENFASPEQYGLFGGNVSAASDVYSLGLVILAMLRGKVLDMSGTQYEQIEKRQRIPDLQGIDQELRPALAMMLEPDPANRRLTMADIAGYFAGRAALPVTPLAATEPATDTVEGKTGSDASFEDVWTLPGDGADAPAREYVPAGEKDDGPQAAPVATTLVSQDHGNDPLTPDPVNGTETEFEGADPFVMQEAEGKPVTGPTSGIDEPWARKDAATGEGISEPGHDDPVVHDAPEAARVVEMGPHASRSPTGISLPVEDNRTRIAEIPAAANLASVLPTEVPDEALSEPAGPSWEQGISPGLTSARTLQPPKRRWGFRIAATGMFAVAASATGLYFSGLQELAGMRFPWAPDPVAVVAEKSDTDLLPPMDSVDSRASADETTDAAIQPPRNMQDIAQPSLPEKKLEEKVPVAEPDTAVDERVAEPIAKEPQPIEKKEEANQAVSEPLISDEVAVSVPEKKLDIVQVEKPATQEVAQTDHLARADAAESKQTPGDTVSVAIPDASSSELGVDKLVAVPPKNDTISESSDNPVKTGDRQNLELQSVLPRDDATSQEPEVTKPAEAEVKDAVPEEEKAKEPAPDSLLSSEDPVDDAIPGAETVTQSSQETTPVDTDIKTQEDLPTEEASIIRPRTDDVAPTIADQTDLAPSTDVTKPAENTQTVDPGVVADMGLLPSMEPASEVPTVATDVKKDAPSNEADPVQAEASVADTKPEVAIEQKVETKVDAATQAEAQKQEQPATEIAALEPKPNPDLGNELPSKVLEPEEWVRNYDGGPCFFAEVTRSQGQSVKVSSISNDMQAFHALDASFEKAFGYPANIQGRPIDGSQCLVTKLLNTLHKQDVSQIGLKLDSDKIKSGDFLSGEIERNDAGQSPLLLLLVDHSGWVYNISNRAKAREDGKVFFSQSITDKGLKPGTFKIVLALSGDTPLPGASSAQPVKSSKLIPRLIEAANKSRLQYAYGFFKITTAN